MKRRHLGVDRGRFVERGEEDVRAFEVEVHDRGLASVHGDEACRDVVRNPEPQGPTELHVFLSQNNERKERREKMKRVNLIVNEAVEVAELDVLHGERQRVEADGVELDAVLRHQMTTSQVRKRTKRTKRKRRERGTS